MEKQINGKITEFNEPFIVQRADPYVYRHTDGSYYFSASVPEYDKIILRKSDTLKGLKDAEEICVWHKHESGDMSEHIWAPEIHYLNGTWYIYFGASQKENKWRLRPYVLECEGNDPLKDKWVEKGKMQRSDDDIQSFDEVSLDATVFEHKGENYFVWAEKVGVGVMISNLYIAKMESPTKLKTAQVLLTTPDYDWERADIWVNEGPAVLKHDGRIYLTYSASATNEKYCVGMLSISEDADLLDPREWVKEKKPVIATDSEKGFFGPGHNSFTKLPDGRDVCVFHARTYKELQGAPLYDPNRHTMLMEVKWDENSRPIFDYKNMLK